MILTIAEIKTLARFCGLVLTDGSMDDKDQDETEIAVVNCPEDGLTNDDASVVFRYDHVAYFCEYPDEGSVGLGEVLE